MAPSSEDPFKRSGSFVFDFLYRPFVFYNIYELRNYLRITSSRNAVNHFRWSSSIIRGYKGQPSEICIITAARVTSTTIGQLLPYAPSTSFEETAIQVTTLTVIEQLPPDVAMACTSSTQQREQPVGTESETPGRETSLNEQPAGTGPVEAPSIGGATNENNNGEREARPAKKKKKSKKSKVEKRLARFKTCCSLLNRERMIRAEQQRIYLIERNKINDLREKFVIVGPAGNVYTVTIAHLPDCNCPDFTKGFLCKHIFFVYLKVLGVNRDSTLIYQKALLSKELRSIFTNARPSWPSNTV
ncbi:unnamed protein product [Rhizophagus irregularis]|nr:unnamed protein product [Rhizophagus irregularis]